MSSAVHTGLGGGVQRTNNSPLDCLEHNDRITYITWDKQESNNHNGLTNERFFR